MKQARPTTYLTADELDRLRQLKPKETGAFPSGLERQEIQQEKTSLQAPAETEPARGKHGDPWWRWTLATRP
jgi:hypothetical protein